MKQGYYLFPTVHEHRVVFVSDNDLWSIDFKGGTAIRLTDLQAPPAHPILSPDGLHIAFTGQEEGSLEVYVMPSTGGEIRRLTYNGNAATKVTAWTPDSRRIVFVSTAGSAFRSHSFVHEIDKNGGYPEKLPCGVASSVSFGPGKGMTLGRFGRDPAQWKRYRGGRMGVIWIDQNGSGQFKKLLDLKSNMTYPMWIGDRIYFMGDHEGWGNIYSCDLSGNGLNRHTDHDGIYVRNPKTDGKTIVYHAGGDLWGLNVSTGENWKLEIEFPAIRRHRSRRFVKCGRFLDSYHLHPKGHAVTIVSRGKTFCFDHWEGAVTQFGIRDGSVRYRLAHWLNDGERIVVVSDEGGEEHLEIFSAVTGDCLLKLDNFDLGRVLTLNVNPVTDQVVVSNHRQELIWIDLQNQQKKTIDTSNWGRIHGTAWSPDGAWLAYGFSNTLKTSLIKLWKNETDQKWEITRPVLRDFNPSFDPKGRYLYFLSARIFDPVLDPISFDYNFPKGVQPMVLTLRSDLPSPFVNEPIAPGEEEGKPASAPPGTETVREEPIRIDLEGIFERVLAVPVPEERYNQIAGGNEKIFFVKTPVEGTLSEEWLEAVPSAKGVLEVYDLKKQAMEVFVESITDFSLSRTARTLVYRAGEKIRVVKTDEKPDAKAGPEPGRKSGWIDMDRISIEVDPMNEWRQMYHETWRLLRDHYHHADMSGVDWRSIHDKYLPILQRISTRWELSDLLWELGGELGTSHCYEIGGDYPAQPRHPVGLLGADITFDPVKKKCTLAHIVRGDSWDESARSPLKEPGLNVLDGDSLIAINGIPVTQDMVPGRLLLGLAGQKVRITIQTGDSQPRTLTIKTLASDSALRLREMINSTTDYVHERTGGKVGYIYMQDMGSAGYSQFFRSFLSEVQREALIVDVRNNAGGHVSQLLLEKLARKRLGYDVPRYGKWGPIPTDSLLGPIVALTDEHSGSDGDIFSHTFKMMKLGLMIGTYTWGGIVGLNPTHPLIDGTITTQPEFYNWFMDVGWDLENRGAEPDIIIDIAPQDYARSYDPQLERALTEIMEQIRKNPPVTPDFGQHPSRVPPVLPPRK